MHFPSPLKPQPQETPLKFGLVFSAVGSFLALATLASCAYFIPQSTNAPRYNTVEGERRAPQLNGVSSAPRTDPRTMNNPAFQPQSAAPASIMTPSPPANVERPFVESTTPAPTRAAPVPPPPIEESYSWWNPAGWYDGDVPPAATSARQVPPQNAAIEAQGYMNLEDTPPSPLVTGQAGARDDLTNARGDLEAERTAADRRASQLATDAAAEPSLLATQPDRPPAPSVMRPVPTSGGAAMSATPKILIPQGQSYSGASTIAQEPIQLRPPAGDGVPATTGGGQSTSASTMNPTVSGFDPMTGADAPPAAKPLSTLYPGSGYLPPSRYGASQSY